MNYKEVITLLKQTINDHTPKQRYSKLWGRKNQSSWSRFKEGTKLPKPDPQASATRATVLCAAIAHSRRKLHFHEGTREEQRSYIEGVIKNAQRVQEWAVKYPDRNYTPTLSQEEVSMVEFLLDVEEADRRGDAWRGSSVAGSAERSAVGV